MKLFKPKFWDKQTTLIGILLMPISIFLQILVLLKSKITKRIKVSIPIICVGNIYIGGTGKTPLTLEIVSILKELNKKVAIVKKDYQNQQDEFKLIESKEVRLFKNVSRITSINNAISNGFETVVLDDGFQDFSVERSLDIVCFNEKQLIGNGMTLPSGPLREPFSSLKRCQIIMINGETNLEFEKKIKGTSNNISIYYSKYLPTNIENFKNQNLLAFAGVGNPENFFNLLLKNNLNIIKKISFPDHYNYSLKELKDLINYSKEKKLKLITTEKDYFRIKHFKLPEIVSLNVKLEILNRNNFQKEIIKYL